MPSIWSRETFKPGQIGLLTSKLLAFECRRSVRRPHSLNIFSSETTGPIEAKFHMESPWDRRTKVYSNVSGHMTKIAPIPVYGKNLKNLLLKNRNPDDLKT